MFFYQPLCVPRVFLLSASQHLLSLFDPKEYFAEKGWTIQDNLYLVCTIIDTEDKAALINLDQSKAFDKVNHYFLVTVLSRAEFEPNFRRWIRLLYNSSVVMLEVDWVRSLCLDQFIDCPLTHMLYIVELQPFSHKPRNKSVLRGITLLGATITHGLITWPYL